MYNCQKGLISHLKAEFATETYTVKEYEGEIATIKKTGKTVRLLPAILVFHILSSPVQFEPEHNFDLLILSSNKTMQKGKSKIANMQFVEQITEFIKENQFFQSESKNYVISLEALKVKHLATDDKFSLMSISLNIKEYN